MAACPVLVPNAVSAPDSMKGSLRIGLVLERYDASIGGLEGWTDGLARWLVDRGHQVSIIASEGTCNVPAMSLHLVERSQSPASLAASIAACLSRLSLDIVHDMGFGYRADVIQPHSGPRSVGSEIDVAALPALRRLRARISPRLRAWRREIAALERRQFADPSRLIAISRMVREQIAARYNLDAREIAIIHNGVDAARFSPERLAPLRDGARARWSLQEMLVFLLVANNFHLKGVADAIRALARLRRVIPEARLVIAGSGDAAPYIRLARRLGVAEQLAFLGHVAKIEEAYSTADILLQPTHYDPCSLVTLEAMACALPVLTTSSNGSAELIADGNEGFILQRAGDDETLVAAMERLRDPVLRRRMGIAGRKAALAHGLENNHSRVEEFYRRRLAAKGQPVSPFSGR